MKDPGGAGSADRGDRVEVRLVEIDDAPDRGEEAAGPLEIVVGGTGAGGDRGDSQPDRGGGVRHGADDGGVGTEGGSDAGRSETRHDADGESTAVR